MELLRKPARTRSGDFRRHHPWLPVTSHSGSFFKRINVRMMFRYGHGEPFGRTNVPWDQAKKIAVTVKRIACRDGPDAYVLTGETLAAGDLYIWVFARWHDQEGSGLSQDAAWTFHVRTY